MQAIGKWILGVILGWLSDFIIQKYREYQERKERERAQANDNEAAGQKLEEAKSEQEVIDAGSDLLRR